MNWLKNELKFNGILFWIIFLIIGLILAIKEITFVMLCYSSIMLVGCVLTRVGKHYNKEFAKRKWYFIGIVAAGLWFIISLIEIGMEIQMMPAPENLMEPFGILKNIMLVVAVVAYGIDVIVKRR